MLDSRRWVPLVVCFVTVATACSSSTDHVSDLGSDAAPSDCASVSAALRAFADAHRSCSAATECTGLDALGDPALCEALAAPGGDAPGLEKLKAQHAALHCGSVECGGSAIRCQGGQCVRDPDGAGCAACPSTEALVCTDQRMNAINACQATECFGQKVAHAGLCADGPVCKARGGHCAVRRSGWFCPDGERFDPGDSMGDCAQGAFDGTCCMPGWAQPCTYLGVVSGTLSLNPFTCAAADVPICVSAPDATTCSRAVSIGRSVGNLRLERIDQQSSMTAQADGGILLVGDDGKGHTFQCTGKWSAALDFSNPLTCQVCNGVACSPCVIQQHHACESP